MPEVYAAIARDVLPVLAALSAQGPAGPRLLKADALGGLLASISGQPTTFIAATTVGGVSWVVQVYDGDRIAGGAQLLFGPQPGSLDGTLRGPFLVLSVDGDVVTLNGNPFFPNVGAGSAVWVLPPVVLAGVSSVSFPTPQQVVPIETVASFPGRVTAVAQGAVGAAVSVQVANSGISIQTARLITASMAQIGAGSSAAGCDVVLRDGVSGAGAIIWRTQLAVPVTLGAVDRIALPHVDLQGSQGNPLTLETTGGIGPSVQITLALCAQRN